MLCQTRYDSRDAISQLVSGTTCSPARGAANSTRYRNGGDWSIVSMTRRMPEAKSVPLAPTSKDLLSSPSASSWGELAER